MADPRIAELERELDATRRAYVTLRTAIENGVQAGIAVLNQHDGDPDLEPSFGFLPPGVQDEAEEDGDAEPSLGATADINQARGWTKHGGGDDAEDEFDGREDGHDAEDDKADSEWSLGWTERIHQGLGDQGLDRDLEAEHDGREPDADGEPDYHVVDPRDPIDQRELERPW